MFASVRGLDPVPTRLRPALAVALLAHGAMLALSLWLGRPRAPEPEGIVHVVDPRLRPAHTSHAPGATGAPRTPPSPPARTTSARHAVRVDPRRTPATAPSTPPRPEPIAKPETPDAPHGPGGPDGQAGPGGPSGPGGPACVGPCSGSPGPEVLEESAVARVPRLRSGPPIHLPAEVARQAVAGRLGVRCTIATDGSVRDCVVVGGGAPLVEGAVLAALQARSYVPAEVDGRPVSVRHRFDVDLRTPR